MSTFEGFLHVGAILLPLPAGVIAYFLRATLSRLDRVEGKLDSAAEVRGEMKARIEGLGDRISTLETRLDKVA